MAGINLKYRQIKKILLNNGFKEVRAPGDHHIFKRHPHEIISIPMSCNGLIVQRLFREFNIKR